MSPDFNYDDTIGFLRAKTIRINDTTPAVDNEVISLGYLKNYVKGNDPVVVNDGQISLSNTFTSKVQSAYDNALNANHEH